MLINQGLPIVAYFLEVAKVAGDSQLRQFADSPKTQPEQVFTLVTSVVKVFLGDAAKNLLRTVIDNGRLAAMPEIAVMPVATASDSRRDQP